MRQPNTSRARGFTFVELMVSIALGLLVVGAAVKLFSQGVDATWVVSQRAEMQQDLRSVQDILTKDISMAGAGMTGIPGENIPLPHGTVTPVYGCDQTGTSAGCPPNGAVNYPCIGTGCAYTLYPLMPGYALGVKPPGSTTTTDLITVAYTDTLLAINCYTITFNTTGNVLTFTAPSNPPPSSCILPPGKTYPQAVNDSVVGLTQGDVVMVSKGSTFVVGEVTNVAGPTGAPAPGMTYTVTFADGDVLHLNQSAQANDLTTIKAGTGQVANRIYVVTYYVKVNPDPTGVTTGTPVLMRQVSGHTAVPVAENVINMQFTYDTYDSAGDLLNEVGDAGESTGNSPNLIRKINILHLTIRSQLAGTRSSLYATNGYQGYDVQTSISARDLSYQNRYTFAP